MAEADRLWAEGERLRQKSTNEAHVEGWLDPRVSLMHCAQSRPLFARAAELRREVERDLPARADAAATPSRPVPDLSVAPEPTPRTDVSADASVEAAVSSVTRWLPPARTASAQPEDARVVGSVDEVVAGVARWLPLTSRADRGAAMIDRRGPAGPCRLWDGGEATLAATNAHALARGRIAAAGTNTQCYHSTLYRGG